MVVTPCARELVVPLRRLASLHLPRLQQLRILLLHRGWIAHNSQSS